MKATFPDKKNNRTALLIRLAGTLLAIGLLISLLSQQGWKEIGAAISLIPPWRFALALGLILLSRLAVAGRWYVLLRSAGVHMSVAQSVRITFAGLFASNFLPTTIGGDVVRLAGAVQLNLDAMVSAASLVVDRLIGMLGMAMVLPFGLPQFLQNNGAGRSLSTQGLASLAIYAALLPVGTWGQKILARGRQLAGKLLRALSVWVNQPAAMLQSLLFSWIHMLCVFGAIWLFFGGMGEAVPFMLAGGLYSLVYFVTLLPLSINGYGIQEVSMTFVFSVVAGASTHSSLAAALLFRTVMMLGSLPGALFVPALLPGTRDQTDSIAESNVGMRRQP